MKDEVVQMMLDELEIDSNGYPHPTEEEFENWCDAMDAHYSECQRLGVQP